MVWASPRRDYLDAYRSCGGGPGRTGGARSSPCMAVGGHPQSCTTGAGGTVLTPFKRHAVRPRPDPAGRRGQPRACLHLADGGELHCFSAAPPPDQRPMDHPCQVMWQAPSGSDIAPGSQPVRRPFKRGPDGWRLVGLSMILMVGRRQRSTLVGLLGRGYRNNMAASQRKALMAMLMQRVEEFAKSPKAKDHEKRLRYDSGSCARILRPEGLGVSSKSGHRGFDSSLLIDPVKPVLPNEGEA